MPKQQSKPRVEENPIADVFENRHPSATEKNWAEKTLAPTLEKLNIVSTTQVSFDTLADRMRSEVVAKRAIAMSYGLVGAWARKPFTHES